MVDTYCTIRRRAHAQLRVLGSRFIAQAFPVANSDGVQAVLDQVRSDMHDATHHCFAYCLGPDRAERKFSDAGEPSGTAGRPIMLALERQGVTDVIVVVTRYFGGTKLGTGGLARAYGEAASRVLEACERQDVLVQTRLAISLPDHLIGELMHLVALYEGKVAGTGYEETTRYDVDVRSSRVNEFCAALSERTGGSSHVEWKGERAVSRPPEREH